MCYVGEVGQTLSHAISSSAVGTEEVTGRNRSLRADLVVVDDLSRLHGCLGESSVQHALVVIARGLPVITSASWALAQGDPTRVPKESIIRHRPVAQEQRAIFEYDVQFAAMEGNLVRALQALASLPKSKWSVRPLARVEAPREAAAGVVLLSGSGGIQALRAFVQKRRRIRNCSDGGSRAWSLGGPLV